MRKRLAVVALLLLAACSGGDDANEDASTTSAATADPAATGDDLATEDPPAGDDGGTDSGTDEADGPRVRAAVQGMPDTLVGNRFAEVLDGALTGTLTEGQITDAFHPLYLEQVPAASLLLSTSGLPGLLGTSPVVAELQFDATNAMSGILVNPTDASRWFFLASVGVTEPHRLLSFELGPDPSAATDPDPSIADLDAAEAAWAELASEASLLITEVDLADSEEAAACAGDGTTGDALAIGSAFKLYVLAAVATAVDTGRLSWSDELAIAEELKSLPSGQLHAEETGTPVSVAIAAELMIAISDNTATDLLIDAVGREAVAAELVTYGHHDPGLNEPFLTTREFFQLKLGGDADRLDRYAAGDATERREILAAMADEGLPELTSTSFTEPTALRVEWLATPGDLCRVLVGLAAAADDDPDLAAALYSARGPIEERAWPIAAFKGGSEAGVLSLNWLAADPDGTTYVVSGILNDPESVVSDIDALALSRRIFELLEA